MKLNAILGKGTGKLGGMVLSVNSGEQIVREYNPKVSNPQTDAQVEQRAKFKLLSQIAADLSASIAFRKMKMQSPRNRFVSANMGIVSFENKEASVPLDELDITGGSLLLPSISDKSREGGTFKIKLDEAAPIGINRVVYCFYKTAEEHRLQFLKEEVVSEAGNDRKFACTTTLPETSLVVYAYGIKDISNRASTMFKNYLISSDEETGVLNILRSLNSTEYVLTATSAVYDEI